MTPGAAVELARTLDRGAGGARPGGGGAAAAAWGPGRAAPGAALPGARQAPPSQDRVGGHGRADMSDGVGRVAVYVGIDPGLDGAVAVVCAGGGLLDWCDTPTLEVERRGARRREYADAMMARVLGCVAERWMVAGVALEDGHSMPAQGVRR